MLSFSSYVRKYDSFYIKLRQINRICFPVSYNDSFYKEIVKKKDENLCKFAYVNGFVIGAICARIETNPDSDNNNSKKQSNRIYIMTLAVLAAYRSRGAGTKLVESILEYYESNKDDTSHEMYNVNEITLHVQTSNQDAIKFYVEKFGFVQGELVPNYYRRIDPPDCYVLSKKLT